MDQGQGLLLKESPEPTDVFYCRQKNCSFVSFDQYKLRIHLKSIHGQVYEYFLEPETDVYYEYLKVTRHYETHLTKKMIDIPLIVAGGVRNEKFAFDCISAGADIVHVGTAIEKSSTDFSKAKSIMQKISSAVKKGGKQKLS